MKGKFALVAGSAVLGLPLLSALIEDEISHPAVERVAALAEKAMPLGIPNWCQVARYFPS
jgi:hypothetical protein